VGVTTQRAELHKNVPKSEANLFDGEKQIIIVGVILKSHFDHRLITLYLSISNRKKKGLKTQDQKKRRLLPTSAKRKAGGRKKRLRAMWNGLRGS